MVNKRAYTPIWLILGSIIIVALLVTGVLYATGVLQQSIGVSLKVPSGCKSSILSIDKTSISRSSSTLGEQVYQLTLTGREGGQCVYGYLDSNELEQEIESATGKDIELKYDNPFLISINRKQSNANYKIDSNYEREIKSYKYYSKGSPITTFISVITCKTGSLTQSSCSKQCAGKGYSHSNCEDEGSKGEACYCWDFPIQGYVYGFNADRLSESLDVVVSLGDGSSSTISLNTDSNIDAYQKVFKDGLYVTFEGFLQGTNLIPDANAKIYDKSGTKTIVSSSAGISATQSPLCEDKISYSAVESCMLQYNNALKLGFNTPSEFSKATISGTQISLPISDDSFYPVIKIQLKAKWLGIYEPVSKPDISNCQSVTTEFRNSKETDATYDLGIKEGTGSEGTFNIKVSCSNDNFKVLQSKDSQTVTEGNIVSGKIRVTQQANEDSSSTCKITASINRLGFSAEDSCTFVATGKASCSIASEQCGDGCCEGLKCNNNVCEKVVGTEICYNEEDDDGDGLIDCLDNSCKDSIYCGGTEPGEESTCAWYDIFCHINKFLIKLKLLFSIIFGFIAGILGLSYITKLTQNSRNTALKIILAFSSLLIFGFTVGILTWIFAGQLLFLIIIVIVLICLGVVRAFLGYLMPIKKGYNMLR